MTYDDARLAAIYDIDNPDGPDYDFFRSLADETAATRIVDLGCGTGILTVTLTRDDRLVTGIDPAGAMLDLASRRPGGDEVRWIRGTSASIAQGSADLVLMTGNVAMHILGDAWYETLDDIAAGLRSGGVLAFESRNPEAKAWEQWGAGESDRQTPVGALRESVDVDAPDEHGVVVMHCHKEFLDESCILDIDQSLQSRSRAEIVEDLGRAGLQVDGVYRNWDRDVFTGGSGQPLMVFVARRP